MTLDTRSNIKVAVIGSGLAGLTAAHHLSGSQAEVHLFEKAPTLGMDAASISVHPEQNSSQKNIRIDVPMRSFMSGYYDRLTKLYKHLNISVKRANFSFGWYSVHSPYVDGKSGAYEPIELKPQDVTEKALTTSYLLYSGSRSVGTLALSSRARKSLSAFLIWLYHFCIVTISYFQLLILATWHHATGHLQNQRHSIASMTLGQWFQSNHFHPFFVLHVFVPLFAAVCTNSWESMLKYPAADVLEYIAMGLFNESYVVAHGVEAVVRQLITPVKHVHLATEIVTLEPVFNDNDDPLIRVIDAEGNAYVFDHIIFATQGNQALNLIQRYKQALMRHANSTHGPVVSRIVHSLQDQIDTLSRFQYDTSLVINHKDTSLLPRDRTAWRALNMAILDKSIKLKDIKSAPIIPYPHDTTMTTHILNMTHSEIDQDTVYLQTTNPIAAPRPDTILSVSWFQRATVTLDSKAALNDLFCTCPNDSRKKTLGDRQGRARLWFVGSYAWTGIPLLEGCVVSAEKVVVEGIGRREGLDITIPW
ncbi:hypothetical protein NQZ79_g1640 [Umbelopsis isabellina]|nr:hypothetical protein NQZ79_g1640 [Umbelopsis isabellina]